MRQLLFLFLLVWAAPAVAEDPRTLLWPDLLPEGEMERLEQLWAEAQAELEAGIRRYDEPIQFGTFNVVESLDGVQVRVPGYVLPFQYRSSGKISEFLLVPYFGACIHSPPPPPNQMVYVKASEPVDFGEVWAPVWVIGIMHTQKKLNELGDAAYTLELQRWEKYDG